MKTNNPTQWRSMNALLATSEERTAAQHEFPEGASELNVTDVNRRQFLGLLGASAALAGAGLTGCMRKRVQHIVPFTSRPEDFLPGEARYYASNLYIGEEVVPVLVRSNDGRPSKIDGNPRATDTRGRSTAFAQAEVLAMYDTDRLREGRKGDAALAASSFAEELAQVRAGLAANGGQGAALVVANTPSPSLNAQLTAFKKTYPSARVVVADTLRVGNQAAALAAVGAENARVIYDLSEAKVVVTLDADILHTEGEALRNTVAFSAKRTISTPQDDLNRLYSFEPTYSVTGSNADHHVRIPASQIGNVARAIAGGLGVAGVEAPAPEAAAKVVAALINDLKANNGASVVAVGERQPAWVHQLGLAINQALGNIGKTVRVVRNAARPVGDSLASLVEALNAGQVQTVITLGVDAVYLAAGDLKAGEAFAKAANRIALAYNNNATAKAATLVIPQSHALEAWGDFQADSGHTGVQQPLIEPLFNSLSAIQVIEHLVRADAREDYDIVRQAWENTKNGLGFDAGWRRWLHDGIGPAAALEEVAPQVGGVAPAVAAAAAAQAPSASAIEIAFQNSATILDGRYANQSWMQEYPNPVSKLTWDNAVLMSPATAKNLGVKWGSGQETGHEIATVLEVTVNGVTVQGPAFIIPGIAENTVVLEFGYGQEIGHVANGAGFDVRPLTTQAGGLIATGATIKTTGKTYKLATTQDHWSLVPNGNENYARPLVLSTDIEGYRKRPNFVLDYELMRPSQLRSLWTEPNPRTGQQWGMTIDLTSCTGCGACTIACQSENNIPCVGKEEILNGRELHWIRIDRYFVGDESEPTMVNQPVGCAHCENAPCEQVCPVAATIHSPEGLNDMAYNRCIGTRYCANNCPYKVRRFNFFAYAKYETQSNELSRLQRNPRVSIRHRGVMEKCTYCVQRINTAKIEAKRDGNGIIADGTFKVACEQACPAGAIIFGDINDPSSRVSIAKKQDRNYELLAWLNIKPRTTYLAKVRNPNPELA